MLTGGEEHVRCLEPDRPGGGAPVKRPDDEHDERDDADRVLKCAHCLNEITRARARIEVQGKHRHTCVNPHGVIYTVGCFCTARGCVLAGEESAYWSWFSGYAWQIVVCGRCLEHLGWRFRGVENTFWGLVLDRLVE